MGNFHAMPMRYFKAGKLYNSCIVEELNLRINLCMRKGHAYRSFELLQVSVFHMLGKLPEPKFTHKFPVEPKNHLILSDTPDRQRKILSSHFQAGLSLRFP